MYCWFSSFFFVMEYYPLLQCLILLLDPLPPTVMLLLLRHSSIPHQLRWVVGAPLFLFIVSRDISLTFIWVWGNFPLLLVSGSFLILIGVGGWFCMDWWIAVILFSVVILVGVDANSDLVFINCNSITSKYCFPSKMNSSPAHWIIELFRSSEGILEASFYWVC
jgi:hypothetical protein